MVRSVVVECYCIMVKTGGEDRFKEAAEQRLSERGDSSRLFFFRKRMTARSGVAFLEPLFPGYIFMET